MSAYEICRLDAVELAKLIRTRELSAVEVMQAHLDVAGREVVVAGVIRPG